MSVFARAVTVGLAVVLCAWFGLGVIQARDTTRATSLIAGSRSPTPAQLRQAGSLLDSAGTLNPDETIPILRAMRDLAAHHAAQAERALRSVTRAEPLNLDAWVQLAFAAARNGDSRTATIAAQHASELHPRIP